MSLKAKLEAVIYAAEEPVTLVQLAAIFAEDALAWKYERDAELSARNPGLALSLEAVLSIDGGAEAGESAAGVVAAGEKADGTLGDPAAGVTAELSSELAPELEAELDLGLDLELEARRAERRRDREVREILRGILDELIAEYAGEERGLEIREIAGGFRMGTKPEIHDAVRAFVKSLKPPMKLSLPALETLAVIAYKQPVTAPEVGEIRGVDSAGVLGSLLSRKLIATAGRKQVIGRPILYKTTKEFLVRFGLKDVNELPSMEEFEKMAALELDDDAGEGAFSDSHEIAEPVEVSGDLFGESDVQGDPLTVEQGENKPEEQDTETFIPAAEPLDEGAGAYTTVERRNEEKIEVGQ